MESVESGNAIDLVRGIVYQAIRKANNLNDSMYRFKLDVIRIDINNDKSLNVEFSVSYAIKFMEISSEASEALDNCNYGEDCELSEDELERAFDSLYNAYLDEINSQYSLPLSLKLTLELNKNYTGFGDVSVNAEQLLCEKDYCNVGLSIDVLIERMDPDYAAKFEGFIRDKLAELLVKIVELALI